MAAKVKRKKTTKLKKAKRKTAVKKTVAKKKAPTRKSAVRKTSKVTARRKVSPARTKRKSAFQKILTAEGWKRLMMGAKK